MKEYNFDVETTTKALVEWIREWFENNGKGCNAVIGLSGGKDSSITAALCCEALGKDRVIGVLMPNGEQRDIDDAFKIAKHLGIRHYVCNINEAFKGILRQMPEDIEVSKQTTINLPPRLRMCMLYAISQSVNGRVANTCNYSEDYVGYSTKYGDAAGDFAPLGALTVHEVRAIGRYLNVPIDLVEKAPSDGLSGKTDEDNLGFTYKELDDFIRMGIVTNEEHIRLIEEKHRRNLFKLKPIEFFKYPIE